MRVDDRLLDGKLVWHRFPHTNLFFPCTMKDYHVRSAFIKHKMSKSGWTEQVRMRFFLQQRCQPSEYVSCVTTIASSKQAFPVLYIINKQGMYRNFVDVLPNMMHQSYEGVDEKHKKLHLSIMSFFKKKLLPLLLDRSPGLSAALNSPVTPLSDDPCPGFTTPPLFDGEWYCFSEYDPWEDVWHKLELMDWFSYAVRMDSSATTIHYFTPNRKVVFDTLSDLQQFIRDHYGWRGPQTMDKEDCGVVDVPAFKKALERWELYSETIDTHVLEWNSTKDSKGHTVRKKCESCNKSYSSFVCSYCEEGTFVCNNFACLKKHRIKWWGTYVREKYTTYK